MSQAMRLSSRLPAVIKVLLLFVLLLRRKTRVGIFREILELSFGPGKSFGLKFIPNQSDLFRNLFPRQSQLIRVNPKKFSISFDVIRLKINPSQSESIRDFESERIRTNLSILMNPRSEFFGLIRIEYSV